MTTLSGSSVLIVGASGVLGAEIARLLAAAGARLTLTGRDADKLAALNIPGTVVAADLTQADAPNQLVSAAVTAYGGLDGIVNAAGLVAFGAASEVADDTLDTLFAVNAVAPMRLLAAANEALAASGAAGREPFVLTLSGVVSEAPTAGMAAYSASKAALAAWSKASARELRRTSIRMLDARPGHTDTGLATRPIAGAAPKLAGGLDPAFVARRIVAAIEGNERDLPGSAFADPAAA